MSVFNAIKDKIVDVKKDLSQSLKSLAVSSVQRLDDQTVTYSSNSDADAELLLRYQDTWSDMHKKSEELGSRAKEVDVLVSNIFQFINQRNSVMNHFLAEVSSVDQLFGEIGKVKENLDHIGKSCVEVESMLTELECIHERQDFFAKKCEHEYQLKKYQRERHLQLEQTKVNLAARHATKVQQFEKQLSATLLERQKVFDQAHNEQMQSYRTTGCIDVSSSPVHAAEAASSIDLADIVIDDDSAELDKFLEATEIDSAPSETGACSELTDETSEINSTGIEDEPKVDSSSVISPGQDEDTSTADHNKPDSNGFNHIPTDVESLILLESKTGLPPESDLKENI